MSPLILSRPSMFSLPKPALRHPSVGCFASHSQLIPPCVIFDAEPCGPSVGKLIVYSCNLVARVLEKKAPLELVEEKGLIIGASNGWVATLKDGIVRLQDDLNPSASDADPKRIPLPPLVTLPHCQTQVVTNMAMSCSSPEEDDCVVAIKFLGPQLSLCRPAQSNPKWINIDIPNSSFFSSSHVMFSKRDEMFRIPSSGGHLIGSWDLQKHMDKPKLQKVRFRKLPKLTKSTWKFLDSCSRSEHLVESPRCETFMVKWYRKRSKRLRKSETKAMMVFELDKEGNAVYTQDIGDLCILLSKSEPFCVSATSSYISFPSLNPNHIYIQSYDEYGYVDISKPLDDFWVFGATSGTNPVPFFIPPQTVKYKVSWPFETE